ncbi:MAG: hypothetical protein V1794_07410 [Candidatus Glassbacteria bacterium]
MENIGTHSEFAGTPPGGRTWTLAWLVVFAVAMAYLEAVVVVYLRELYYPEGFAFPLRQINPRIVLIEAGREAATVVMLVAVAWFGGRTLAERFALFCICFAVWDIFYYVWLRTLIHWPKSLLTWDILFLIPLPWIGPVLSPLAVSVSLLVGAVLILNRLRAGGRLVPNLREWAIALGGALLILLSYTIDTAASQGRAEPRPYRWELLAVGIVAGFYALGRCLFRTRDKGLKNG